MNSPNVIRFSDLQPASSQHYPDAAMRVKGKPMRTTADYFANADHGMRSGIWRSEVGAYRIALPPGKTEVFHLLSGQVLITADGAAPVSFGPGQSGVLPAGFRGIFEIVEAASKLYVVSEQPDQYRNGRDPCLMFDFAQSRPR